MGPSQRDRAVAALRQNGMTRLSELLAIGITAATLARLEREGQVVRLARGLYQLPDAPLDTHHSLAEAVKLVPRAIVCLGSALAFHGLTDHTPAKVWLAIGRKAWRPRSTHPPIRITRFSEPLLLAGVEHHPIEGVSVPIFSVAKTVADLFRYRRQTGDNLAVEGLRQALRQRKATPADLAQYAREGQVWTVMQPYLTALTSDA